MCTMESKSKSNDPRTIIEHVSTFSFVVLFCVMASIYNITLPTIHFFFLSPDGGGDGRGYLGGPSQLGLNGSMSL